MNTWNLRTEILSATHRWYWVVASVLLGALLGWLVSLIWPAPYRATQDIYVGLNAHRATRDLYLADVGLQQFRNLDDFKNWQMEQLNSLAVSDSFMTETLIRLRLADESWQEVDLPELRTMLSIAWRNTGDWHFSAQADSSGQAKQAVSVWSQVVIEEVALGVESAREMVAIDSRMQANSDELVDLESRLILLQETQTALDRWQIWLEAEPVDQPLPPLAHGSLFSLVTNAANWNMGWLTILESAPPSGSLPVDYLVWLVQVRVLLEAEMAAIPAQIEALIREYEVLTLKYAKVADGNRGLSGNMEVGQIRSEPSQITQIRPTGALVLIGSLLGFLVLGIIWLVQITRRTE